MRTDTSYAGFCNRSKQFIKSRGAEVTVEGKNGTASGYAVRGAVGKDQQTFVNDLKTASVFNMTV